MKSKNGYLNDKFDIELLSEDFDSYDDSILSQYSSKYLYDEDLSDNDPADLIDIFPKLLTRESRNYPKFWY